jgi:hypothetical protein
MVEELSNRNRGAILISFDFDDVNDLDDLKDVSFNISHSESMTQEEMRSVILCIGATMFKDMRR